MYHERQVLQRCLLHTLNNLLQQPAFNAQTLNTLCDSIHAQRTRWFGNYDVNVLAAALQQHGLEVRWHDARDTELSSLDHLLANSISSQMCSSHGSGTSTQQQQQHQLGPGPLPPQHQEQPPQQQHNQQQQPEQQQPECPDKADTEDTDTGSDEVVLFGLVLNVAGQGLMSSLSSLVGGGRHWLAIRWLEGQWWNLDSKLPHPVSFATTHRAAGAAAGDEQPSASDAGGGGVGGGGTAALRAFLKQQLAAGAHLLVVVVAHSQQQMKES